MRTQSTLLTFIIMMVFVTNHAMAQSSQYQRPGKKKEAVVAPATPLPPSSGADKASEKATDKTSDKKDGKKDEKPTEKVDISDLEQKYWAPKDVEFSVVQNRLYSKAKRFALTPQIGPLATDSFSSGPVLGLSANYYFSERYGVEAHYSRYMLENSTVTQGFIDTQGTSPDFNRQEAYYGASFNWVPIYAKMSLLDQKIMYFDMSFSPGIGMMQYSQQEEGGTGKTLTSPALSLDVAQHYFLSKEFAIRIDMRNRFYKDEVVKYRSSSTTTRKGDYVKERFNHSVTIQFGFTFYFGG